ncbi:MAG: alpha/beta hydrolase [Deltaproteobacteria bacterium]|nr:alpha/beta hydrolase [Deltaproteobacteria bacterium]
MKSFHVGFQEFQLQDSVRGRELDGVVWYPIDTHTKMDTIRTSPLFRSFSAKRNAPLAKGPKSFPLLLLSHGNAGLAIRFDWLGASFAEKGWIVAAIDHPGNTALDNTPEGIYRVWDRAYDITFLLDELLLRSKWASHINRNQIAVAGHSAGGTTALLLAGARMSKQLFSNPTPHCPKDIPYVTEECEQVAQVDLHQFTKREIEMSYRDARINAVIALDPGFAKSFNPKTTNTVKTPLLFLLADHLKWPNTGIFTEEFRKLFPQANFSTPKNSVHISFLSACNEKNPRSHNAPICIGDTDRPKLHQEINQNINTFLRRHGFGWHSE